MYSNYKTLNNNLDNNFNKEIFKIISCVEYNDMYIYNISYGKRDLFEDPPIKNKWLLYKYSNIYKLDIISHIYNDDGGTQEIIFKYDDDQTRDTHPRHFHPSYQL